MGLVNNRNTATSFECGFVDFLYSRPSFSMRFFFLMLMFILFDVELTLLMQVPLHSFSGNLNLYFSVLIFVGMLTVATVEEWRRGLFSWWMQVLDCQFSKLEATLLMYVYV